MIATVLDKIQAEPDQIADLYALRTHRGDRLIVIRLQVPAQHVALTLDQAAALRSALDGLIESLQPQGSQP